MMGRRVKRNATLGIAFLKTAATDGDAIAKYNLAIALLETTRAKGGQRRAVALLREAAVAGMGEAAEVLGDCYRLGEGVRRDGQSVQVVSSSC